METRVSEIFAVYDLRISCNIFIFIARSCSRQNVTVLICGAVCRRDPVLGGHCTLSRVSRRFADQQSSETACCHHRSRHGLRQTGYRIRCTFSGLCRNRILCTALVRRWHGWCRYMSVSVETVSPTSKTVSIVALLISSLFKLTITLVPLMLSHLLVHLPPLPLRPQIALFSMPRLISGINFHFHFVNQFHLFMLTSIHPSLLHFPHPSPFTLSL